MRRILVLWLMLLLSAGAAEAADLAEMVRDLNALQNRMAIGDAKARNDAAKQFEAIDAAIAAAEPESWKAERNIRAASVYLLCGGAPAALREIHDAGFAPEGQTQLLDASLRYAEGEIDAHKSLLEIDAKAFPPILGGHLALVQGGSMIGVDNARAIALLDLARLLMPGSLVEEAALRREIALIDPAQHGEKLSLLTDRYVAKYAGSPYASHFWEQFLAIFLDASAKTEPRILARLEAVLDKAAPGERLDVFLALSRRALLAGRFEEAANRLHKAEATGPGDAARKRIAAYRGVLLALSAEQGASALRDIDLLGLKPEEQQLVRVATGVATRLSATVERHGARASPEAAEADSSPIAAKAREALQQSQALLERASRR